MTATLAASLLALLCVAPLAARADAGGSAVRIILVGDSTLAPGNGYGDALCARFIAAVRCINMARNGRSSGSYRQDGSWDAVKALLADTASPATTYVLVEFGHNDQPGKPGRSTDLQREFPVNLAGYVQEIRSAGATPVLATPLTRRSFKQGVLQDDLAPWAAATRAAAAGRHVALIDLHASSSKAVQAMGPAEADTLAVEAPPPVSSDGAGPSGRNDSESTSPAHAGFDHTHVGAKGAAFFARMVEALLRDSVPALQPYFGTAGDRRPQLSADQALQFSMAEVLGHAGAAGAELRDPWNPLSDALVNGSSSAADYTVDPQAPASAARVFRTVQAAVNQAVIDARTTASTARIRIRIRPGVYRELVYVPAASVPITLQGDGGAPGDTVITASLDADVTAADYGKRYAAQFAGTDPAIQAMHASVRERDKIGTFGSPTVWVRNAGFQARNLTIENAFRRAAAPTACAVDCAQSAATTPPAPPVQHQAVALMVDGADRSQFERVRLLGLQDTLYLKAQADGSTARSFIHRSYIEGDVDFIFGNATAFFYRTQVRSLGSRKNSYVGAPDTNLRTRHGLVFDDCDFTNDGSPNALAGNYNLSRQWFHDQRCTPFGTVAVPGYACTLGSSNGYVAPRGSFTQAVLETVGKMVVLHSRIGSHISSTRPWADWNQAGALSYRPAQLDSDDYWANLRAIGIDPARLGYGPQPRPPLIFEAEFDNVTVGSLSRPGGIVRVEDGS